MTQLDMRLDRAEQPQDQHDPGGKVKLALPSEMKGTAGFSECGRYRHWLTRCWGPGGFVLWIGMNPSTADAMADDPTVRREIGFTQRWGFKNYVKCNVMDYRTTSPKGLIDDGVPPASPENIPTILRFANEAMLIVVCYGVLPRRLQTYALDMVMLLDAADHRVACLGYGKAGSPRHPLYLRSDTELVPFTKEHWPAG